MAKNTHKRVCGADMNSPSGCSSPNQDLSPGDPLDHLTLDFTATKNVSKEKTGCGPDLVGGARRTELILLFLPSLQAPASLRSMTFSESPGLGADDLFANGSPLDDPGQKKVLCQRSTPPPSPLLSELLKKGSLLASKSRTVSQREYNTTVPLLLRVRVRGGGGRGGVPLTGLVYTSSCSWCVLSDW